MVVSYTAADNGGIAGKGFLTTAGAKTEYRSGPLGYIETLSFQPKSLEIYELLTDIDFVGLE